MDSQGFGIASVPNVTILTWKLNRISCASKKIPTEFWMKDKTDKEKTDFYIGTV